MDEIFGLPAEIVYGVATVCVSTLIAFGLDRWKEVRDAKTRARERAYAEIYERITTGVHKLTHWNLDWGSNPWNPEGNIIEPVQNGSLDDPEHHTLRTDLDELVRLGSENGKTFNRMHAKFRSELRSTLKETKVKTMKGEQSLADLLGESWYHDGLFRAVRENQPSLWAQSFLSNLIGHGKGPGYYAYKDPVEPNLSKDLLIGYERQRTRVMGAITDYDRSIRRLIEQGNVIYNGLKFAREQRRLYPGRIRRLPRKQRVRRQQFIERANREAAAEVEHSAIGAAQSP